jgi:hypothetical protein
MAWTHIAGGMISMNFKTAEEVRKTLLAGEDDRRTRSANRALVDQAVNGFAYLSEDQKAKMGININVNMGEIVVLAAHARQQYTQAALGPQNFFKVQLRNAPLDKQSAWSAFITDKINRVMKESEDYQYLKEYQIGAVVNHGVGAQLWYDKKAWLPEFVAIDDLILPLDTKTSLKNQEWFAIHKSYTEGELTDKVFGDHVVPGWNKKAVQSILKAYHPQNFEGFNDINWLDHPEKMADRVKQSGGLFTSDAVPTIPLIHFYYRMKKKGKPSYWCMCVISAKDCQGVQDTSAFLFRDDKPCAENIHQLLNIQFGDLNTRAPYHVAATRSLGTLLFEPCFWTNMIRCRQLEHLMESFNAWFRVREPGGKARANKIDLFNKSIVPEGVTIVPNTERHQVDPNLTTSTLAEMKQLQNEASMSYTQDLDTGTSKEQTAFEVQTKLTQVSAMTVGLLARWFRKETSSYREIGRRFCLKNSDDEDVKTFQRACQREKIPAEFIDVDKWDIIPEMPMGSGNQTLAMAIAQQLISVRPMMSPESQQIALHMFVEAVTGDAKLAQWLVPIGEQKKVTPSQEHAAVAFPNLMFSVPIPEPPGLNLPDQIETLIGMLAGVITQLSPKTDLMGIQSVAKAIGELTQRLAQDETQGPRVKAYQQNLQQLMQEAQQRVKAMQDAKNGPDEETLAKVRGIEMTTAAKVDSMRKTTEFKLQSKAVSDRMKLQTKAVADSHKLGTKEALHQQDIAHADAATAQEMAHAGAEADSELARENLKTANEIARKNAEAQAGKERAESEAARG